MIDKKALSAFFDGEENCSGIHSDPWFESLHDDEDNHQAWQSYSLTREILRNEAAKTVNWNISAQVADALELEPYHQAQKHHINLAQKIDVENNNVELMKSAQPTAAQAKKTLPVWLQQFAQVGTAAAVSVVVILGVQQYNSRDGTAQISLGQQPPVLQTIPISGDATPVSLSRDTINNADNEEGIQQQNRINEFFQDYELQRRLNAMDLEKVND